ncbi:MAG: hypothetical protein HKO66_16265 [Saprospiraceae bacterium]|nr:hypothetical protein [Saprospiraceae bacterium]
MRKLILFLFVMCLYATSYTQMTDNGVTLYGNEWINYNNDYLKVSVEEKGIYRITFGDLQNNGFSSDIIGSEIQLYNNGNQVPLLTSNEGKWSSDDFLLFYGERNDGEVDRFHYRSWDRGQLNPKQSLYSNTRNYFLTIEEGSQNNPRYTQLENDLSGSLPDKQEFYMHREENVYGERHYGPVTPDVADIQYSSFLRTEGYGNAMRPNHVLEFEVTDEYDAPIKPRVEFRLGTSVSPNHILEFEITNRFLDTDEFTGFKVQDYSYSFNNNLLRSTTKLGITGKGQADNIIVAHASLVYPRAFTANGNGVFVFEREGSSDNVYYEIANFSGASSNYAFDLENSAYLQPVMQDDVAKIYFPVGGELRSEIYIVSDSEIKTPLAFSKRNFQILDNINPQYLILTSELLNNSESGINPIQSYADFRSSTEGGSYDVAILNVEEVIDQFGYGIEGFAYGIRNFSQYIKPKWPNHQMVFIIGKALDYSLNNKVTNIVSYVPTYGHPGSDNLLFSDKGLTYPNVGIGRLAARSKEDVSNYLRKVRIHAALGDVANKTVEERLWLKDVIHLSGGDPGIEQSLYNHLGEMKDILEMGKYGAAVTTFRKTSSDPVQTEVSQEIINKIDNGISLLTFFGHSSAGTFDFSVEDPTKYQNEGRLPLIFSMGCHSGDIHEAINSLSEKMVITEDVGAVAFLASSGAAFTSSLSVLGKNFYDKIADKFYGQPLGLTLQNLTEELYDSTSTKVRTLHEQNTLHGDPAIVLFTAEGPDYVVDFATVKTEGQVGTTDENIIFNFDIVNLGTTVRDSINNMLIHNYGSGSSDTVYFKSLAPPNRTSLSVSVENPGFASLGKNTVNIILDIDNRIEEFPNPVAEENNDLTKAYANEGYCFFVFDNSAFPIYPKEFSIVNEKQVTLKASANNAFATKEYYLLEIDTTENFNSPRLEKGEVFSSPGFIEWSPAQELTHETVYYWRISPKEMENTVWNYSSFVYLENASDGWNQSHAYQWLKDDYETFSYDEPRREFLFAENINEVRIINGTFPAHKPTIFTLNTPYEYLSSVGDGEIPAGVYICVFDGDTGLPWENAPSPDGGLYDSEFYTWWALGYPTFPYRTNNTENRYKAIQFLEDVVPDGHYVAFYTIQRSDFGNPNVGSPQAFEWADDANINPDGRDLMTVLESNGAKRVRELAPDPLPYIFVYRKGDPSYEPKEIISDDLTDNIELQFNIVGRWFEGNVSSTVIGPAQDWNKLLWSLDEVNLEEDEYKLELKGIKENGEEETLVESVEEFDFDLSFVDANIYPHLRLNLFSADSESRSPVQMDYWRVLYQEKPEAVLDVNRKFVFESDSLFLGEPFKMSTLATNISNTDMDSLLVRYTIVDESNKEINEYQTLAPLKAQETTDIIFEYDTEELLGVQQFRVEINPEMAQPEQYLFNNIGIRNFKVQGDRINPILDVTFDGMRIMDGDIISPKPHVRIDLQDENEFLYVTDLSNFHLALQKLPDSQSYPIDLNSPEILFTPADSSRGNKASIDYYPELETGEYIFYAQAEDASGNLSGDQDVEVRFRVVEDSKVSNVLNYPNPFSTSTQFVFTLTGLDVPEVFTIQIMTVSGKVVREITKEELGELRIGLNRTDFKWDGTDEYGSKLANGVYLYRVFTSTSGDSFDQFYNEKIDGFFKEGFGKLVIMR